MIKDKTLDKALNLISAGKMRRITYTISQEEADKDDGNTDWWAWVIPPGLFTKRELKILKKIDEYEHGNCARSFANFLPDGIRPDDVPPL